MKNLFRLDVESSKTKGSPFIDSSNQTKRIIANFEAYRKWIKHQRSRGVPLLDMICRKFPFVLPTRPLPTMIGMELSSVCDLRCVYCPNHLFLRPREFMSEKTFSNFVSGLRESEISRVHIVGNGEPTLHPHFEDYVNKVAESVKYLSLVTNGQWKKESISHSLLRAPVDLIIVSVDGSDKSTYEKSRPKGNFERLLYNLRQLKDLKVKLQSTSLINIRLMLRPSQEKIKKTLIKYWKHFGDVVTEQKVFKIESMDYEEDVYIPLHRNKGTYPKCTELFNNLSVHWNGDVLLCGALEFRKDVPKPLLGTINEHTPAQLWKMPLLRQYRRGQRYRELDKIPICRGCQGS